MVLHVMDHTGDTAVEIETDPDLAQQLFDWAVGEGRMAFAVFPDHNEHVFNLNEAEGAERVVVVGPLVGG